MPAKHWRTSLLADTPGGADFHCARVLALPFAVLIHRAADAELAAELIDSHAGVLGHQGLSLLDLSLGSHFVLPLRTCAYAKKWLRQKINYCKCIR
jgi:hypothetical protein